MEKQVIISNLVQARYATYSLKQKNIFDIVETAELDNWYHNIIKWLRLGKPYTSHDLERFESLALNTTMFKRKLKPSYHSPSSSKDPNKEIQDEFIRKCDSTIHLLDSAVESIQRDSIMKDADMDSKKASEQNATSGDLTLILIELIPSY